MTPHPCMTPREVQDPKGSVVMTFVRAQKIQIGVMRGGGIGQSRQKKERFRIVSIERNNIEVSWFKAHNIMAGNLFQTF